MENTVSHCKTKRINKKTVFITLGIVAFIFIAFWGAGCYFSYHSNEILQGVCFNGESFAGMSQEEAKQAIDTMVEEIKEKGQIEINLEEGESLFYSLKDFDLEDNSALVAEGMYQVGRESNWLKNGLSYWKNMLFPVSYGATFQASPITLSEKMITIFSEVNQEREDGSYILEENEILVFPGKKGRTVSLEELEAGVEGALSCVSYSMVQNKEPSVVPVTITFEECLEVDVDQMAAEVLCDVSNAAWARDEKGHAVILDHQDGISFDVEQAKTLLASPEELGEPISIPIERTQATITKQQLEEESFPDVLGTYTSSLVYNPNRTVNVSLAAKAVSGVILLPNEIFSFNDVVGPRTTANGFQMATIYVNGEMSDGLGGGICQVTSSLYYCMLQADLKTIERRNHRFTVGYIPLGYDATVAYGNIDFRFQNNKDTPIKISAYVDGNTLYTEIIGVKDSDKKVELSTYTTDRVAYGVTEILDATLAPGKRVVTSHGITGYTTYTYQKVFEGEELIRDEMIHKSVYSPCNQVVRVGPALPEVVPPQVVTPETETPEEPSQEPNGGETTTTPETTPTIAPETVPESIPETTPLTPQGPSLPEEGAEEVAKPEEAAPPVEASTEPSGETTAV